MFYREHPYRELKNFVDWGQLLIIILAVGSNYNFNYTLHIINYTLEYVSFIFLHSAALEELEVTL